MLAGKLVDDRLIILYIESNVRRQVLVVLFGRAGYLLGLAQTSQPASASTDL